MSFRVAALSFAVMPVAVVMAADGYDLAGKTRAYLYETKQDVTWTSAGDHLRFSTTMTWRLVLRGRSADELQVAILRVAARHEGPTGVRSVDSATLDPGAEPDPLLGHVVGLEGAILGLTVEPTTGNVTRVTGADAIAKRIAARIPDRVDPTAPSPLEAPTRAVYSPEHLGMLWTALLALPAGPTRLPLAGVPGATLVRTWTGASTWTATVAEGEVPFALGAGSTQVAGQLAGLTGRGTLSLAGGLPDKATGDVTFSVRLTALTQPIDSTHHLTWSMTATP